MNEVTASLTENGSYHNAMIDGEAPEMPDPQDNIGSNIGPGWHLFNNNRIQGRSNGKIDRAL
jgi:hypothetical protein